MSYHGIENTRSRPARLTAHQLSTLRYLARKSGQRWDAAWVLGSDVGAPAACEHLHRKGFVERSTRVGPRGGEHHYYRPTPAGWAKVDS